MIYGKFGPTSYQVWCVDYIGGWLSRVFGQAQGASSCEGMLKERCFHGSKFGKLEFPDGLWKLCWFVRFVFPFPLFPESFFLARCILNRIGILAYSKRLSTGSFKHRWLAFSGGALEVEPSLVRVLKRQSAWWDFWGRCRGSNCQLQAAARVMRRELCIPFPAARFEAGLQFFFLNKNCNLDWTWCNCEKMEFFFFAFHGLDAKGCFCMFFLRSVLGSSLAAGVPLGCLKI